MQIRSFRLSSLLIMRYFWRVTRISFPSPKLLFLITLNIRVEPRPVSLIMVLLM